MRIAGATDREKSSACRRWCIATRHQPGKRFGYPKKQEGDESTFSPRDAPTVRLFALCGCGLLGGVFKLLSVCVFFCSKGCSNCRQRKSAISRRPTVVAPTWKFSNRSVRALVELAAELSSSARRRCKKRGRLNLRKCLLLSWKEIKIRLILKLQCSKKIKKGRTLNILS